MKKCLCLMIIITSTATLYGQVGFNQPNPDAKSILDLTATDKGLLIPRMTTAFRDAISSSPATPESLLVYDTDLKGFYFFQAGTWYSLNEWVKTAGSNNVSLLGNATVVGTVNATAVSSGNITNTGSISSGSVSVSGNVSAGSLSVSGFSSNALVPTGVIVMWSGTVAPIGWALCDGVSGRPDLRGKFIVGYNPSDPDYNLIQNTGGEKKHLLISSESGNPSLNISSFLTTHGGPGAATSWAGGSTDGIDYTVGNIPASNAALPHENRPPYYTLAYIIKL
jgi:microcystin-dependent protein